MAVLRVTIRTGERSFHCLTGLGLLALGVRNCDGASKTPLSIAISGVVDHPRRLMPRRHLLDLKSLRDHRLNQLLVDFQKAP